MTEKTKTKEGSRLNIRVMCSVALMAAVCCIMGPLSIPIGPIPVSLTMVAVFLSEYALGTKWGTLSYVIYLLIGLVGAPVFSGFTGGVGKLFGPTGGYLFGMIFMGLITGLFITVSEKLSSKILKILVQTGGMILGAAVNYLLGTIYFISLTHVSFTEGLMTCVVPFVAIDMIKILLVLLVGNTVRKALTLANLRIDK
ncbi:MAG: biotin transporter BioY [Lachnospiraceae bacterium]|nr:biotin transporter BioY [Lachnospiraceae bacterium]